MSCTLLLLAVFSLFSITLSENGQLLSVVQIFRHGHRTPMFFTKTNPNKDPKYWDGLKRGELTELGRRQHRQLGAFFRQRYRDFLPTEYHESDLIVKASHSQRTYASARSFLQGLYPDSFEDIPLHKAGRSTLRAVLNCPKYFFRHLDLLRNDDYFVDVERRHEDLYAIIRQNSELRFSPLLEGYGLWDCLHLESLQGLPSEEWSSSLYPFPLTYVARNITMALCGNEELQRLGTGTLLDDIISHFDAHLRRPREKVVLYSGHEVNVGCLLGTFDAFKYIEPQPPPFASSLIFELRRKGSRVFLNGYYKPQEELLPITFKDCDFDCDYKKFKEMFKHLTLSEWEWVKECLSIF